MSAIVNEAVERLDLIRKGTKGTAGWDTHYLMLYALVRAYNPRCIVEAGVLAGCSAIYMGQALKDNFELHRTKGHLYGFDLWLEHNTIPGQEVDAEPALEWVVGNIQEAGLEDWISIRTCDSALGIREIGASHADQHGIDFAFIDGDHRKQGVRADYDAVRACASDQCVIVFHDSYDDNTRDVAKRAAMDGFSEQLQVPAWCELLVCRKPFYWRDHGWNHPSDITTPLSWPEQYRHDN